MADFSVTRLMRVMKKNHERIRGKEVFKMANSVRRATRAIKKAEEDIQQLREKTAKIIHDLNSIQQSANSLIGRLYKAAYNTSKEITETPMGSISLRKSRNNTQMYTKLCDLRGKIAYVPNDLTRALRSLKYAHERLIKKR